MNNCSFSNDAVKAIIWDYDGTMVNTKQKNYVVTQKILRDFLKKEPSEFWALQSYDNYLHAIEKITNWRDLYSNWFGLKMHEVDQIGKMWTQYQLEDDTPTLLYPGIEQVVNKLNNYPQGIVSQNSKINIIKQLQMDDLNNVFECIIGFEEVPIQQQKPAPDGLLCCIDRLMDSQKGVVLFIGDHKTDIECANNANLHLIKKNVHIQILSVLITYGANVNISDWNLKPDFLITKPQELLSKIEEIGI
ncbi:MAG: HAD family hydrolase [Candidatus Marinimicrobia bacterium]|nr:HAD family hydrolase [bacterium]MCG2716306.1 HAD family hydrolase [Candidatus Neomarinimicrobiota bacterium]